MEPHHLCSPSWQLPEFPGPRVPGLLPLRSGPKTNLSQREGQGGVLSTLRPLQRVLGHTLVDVLSTFHSSFFPFTDEDVDAQRGCVTCRRSHSCRQPSQGLNLDRPYFTDRSLGPLLGRPTPQKLNVRPTAGPTSYGPAGPAQPGPGSAASVRAPSPLAGAERALVLPSFLLSAPGLGAGREEFWWAEPSTACQWRRGGGAGARREGGAGGWWANGEPGAGRRRRAGARGGGGGGEQRGGGRGRPSGAERRRAPPSRAEPGRAGPGRAQERAGDAGDQAGVGGPLNPTPRASEEPRGGRVSEGPGPPWPGSATRRPGG